MKPSFGTCWATEHSTTKQPQTRQLSHRWSSLGFRAVAKPEGISTVPPVKHPSSKAGRHSGHGMRSRSCRLIAQPDLPRILPSTGIRGVAPPTTLTCGAVGIKADGRLAGVWLPQRKASRAPYDEHKSRPGFLGGCAGEAESCKENETANQKFPAGIFRRQMDATVQRVQGSPQAQGRHMGDGDSRSRNSSGCPLQSVAGAAVWCGFKVSSGSVDSSPLKTPLLLRFNRT